MTILEREEFQAWKASPVTAEFLSLLAARQQALMAAWGSGSPLTPEQQAQAVILGQLARIRFSEADQRENEPRAATIEDLAGIEVNNGEVSDKA